MKSLTAMALVLFIAISFATVGFAQNAEPATGETVVTTPMPMVQENTVMACGDNVDNDNDGHVDCGDQDCEIFAICVQQPSSEEQAREIDREIEVEIVQPLPVVDPGPQPELGSFCRDGVDNNDDGYIDCHEASCQRYAYCRRHMYVVPQPPDKAPGYFINFGVGLAFPNFRGPGAETSVPEYSESIPFDPDAGLMFSVKTGFLFSKWFGLAANFNFGATGAGNNQEYIMTGDNPDDYKYQGGQGFGHIGGVLRIQWPYCRFVPYLDIAAGYSFMEYQWYIYNADNTWEDIRDDVTYGDNEYIVGNSYVNTEKYRHFTLALEPGFDFFVSSRRFAIGLKAWLPIIASHHPGTDNIGVTASFTYTPTWRERPQLRPEYQRTKVK